MSEELEVFWTSRIWDKKNSAWAIWSFHDFANSGLGQIE